MDLDKRLPDGRSWLGLRATVVGLGREGQTLSRFLAAKGADVVVTDQQHEGALAGRLEALRGLPIRYALGGHPEWVLETDIIFVSPGVPRDIPLLTQAVAHGIPLSSETELFFRLCEARIIGITGSSGKTTTVSLLGNIFRETGKTTWVGGNIGQPLLGNVEQIRPEDLVVLELSSFQLEHMRVSPPVAAILNVTPNHLDRHGSMETYVMAKRQVFMHQQPGEIAVFGVDDPVARRLSLEYGQTHPAGVRVSFSMNEDISRGAQQESGLIVVVRDGRHETICSIEKLSLRGRHNRSNVLAACAISAELGVLPRVMKSVITTFQGVEHRLESVRETAGVLYINDSIATSPERSMAGLSSFDRPIILLAGGRDKHLPWEPWADMVVRRVRALITFGQAKDLIHRAISAALQRAEEAGEGIMLASDELYECSTMEETVATAASIAQPGDVVLLSPGGTSYDAYVDFAERGEKFKQIVRALP